MKHEKTQSITGKTLSGNPIQRKLNPPQLTDDAVVPQLLMSACLGLCLWLELAGPPRQRIPLLGLDQGPVEEELAEADLQPLPQERAALLLDLRQRLWRENALLKEPRGDSSQLSLHALSLSQDLPEISVVPSQGPPPSLRIGLELLLRLSPWSQMR